jgi:hypothetical protein
MLSSQPYLAIKHLSSSKFNNVHSACSISSLQAFLHFYDRTIDPMHTLPSFSPAKAHGLDRTHMRKPSASLSTSGTRTLPVQCFSSCTWQA